MKHTVLVLGLVLAMALGTAKRADACGGGGANYDGIIAAVVVVGGTYVGVTAGMGIKDLSSSNHSMGYGIAETVIHTPLALAWGAAFVHDATRPTHDASGYPTNEKHTMAFGVMTALHGALAAHGIYTIVKRARAKSGERTAPSQKFQQGPPGMFSVGRVSATVTPTPMQNGAGLGLSGAF